MAKRTIQELYKEFMANPSRTPMPGKTKHETALEEAHKQYRQSYNNDMALSLMPKSIEAQHTEQLKIKKRQELLAGITKEDINTIGAEIAKQVSSSAAERAKAKGLVPQSGDENNPGRWVKPGNQKKKVTKKPNKRKKKKQKKGKNKLQSKNAQAKR